MLHQKLHSKECCILQERYWQAVNELLNTRNLNENMKRERLNGEELHIYSSLTSLRNNAVTLSKL